MLYVQQKAMHFILDISMYLLFISDLSNSQDQTPDTTHSAEAPLYPPFEVSSTHEAYENMWLTSRPPVALHLDNSMEETTEPGNIQNHNTSRSGRQPDSPPEAFEAPFSSVPTSGEEPESSKIGFSPHETCTATVENQTEIESDSDSDTSSCILPPFPQMKSRHRKGK